MTGLLIVLSFVALVSLGYIVGRMLRRASDASHVAPVTPSRGRYCYGAREQIRRHRQIVQGRIRVGSVPCLKVRQATGIKWTEV